MKKATIKVYVNSNDPTDKVGSVKAPSGRTTYTPNAKTIASEYAIHSSYMWWEQTVNAPWRSAVDASGAPVRYNRLTRYQERLERRVCKLMKKAGLR